jgi:1,4-alpha-glucan branching enzyme
MYVTRFSDFDISLFKSGKHYRLYDHLGSHAMQAEDGTQGVYFAVWAPNAKKVAVFGDFNAWDKNSYPMKARWDGSGIWETFVPNVEKGCAYKYSIQAPMGFMLEKGDPFARMWEHPPAKASKVWDTYYEWTDTEWMAQRKANAGQTQPQSVYEVHLGSWKKKLEGDKKRSLSYIELAEELVAYVKKMEYTHVEFMPLMEYPYEPSWGYQLTGYFAASSRFGSPQDLMYLIETFHKNNIGVILDWVPSHFPEDAHGLAEFDGTRLYEHSDPRLGFHPDWKSLIFNYGRYEVRSFLISNALFWLDRFHADALRVDAVASMLYLDYSRKHGEWIPNIYGGNENLEAISFLKEFNTAVAENFPDTLTIAEESTAFAGVTRPVHEGGLGFNQKWMMGWMNDTLRYFGRDTLYRPFHQNEITFSLVYAFSERFSMPLSHDEVVHGKGSLYTRMPGDDWKKFANLRTLFGYKFGHPCTKLLFMGGEFGQIQEWSESRGLDWQDAERPFAKGLQACITDLNKLYKAKPTLYRYQFEERGFEWVSGDDTKNSIITFLRKGDADDKPILVVCNFAPNAHENYSVGVPVAGQWKEIFNSDATQYGGSGVRNEGILTTTPTAYHGRAQGLSLRVAPLATLFFEWEEA